MKLTEKQKGILLILLSALLFAAMQIVVNLSGGRIPVMEQVFYRNTISLLVSFVIIRKNKLSCFGERRYWPWLFGRSFFGILGVITMFYATPLASQADVTILSKMSPFIITWLAAVFLRERISRIQLPALLLAFAGAWLVANPSFDSNILPLAMAFASAIFSGVAYTLLSYFKGKVDAVTVIMFFSTFSVLVSLPLMLPVYVVPTAKEFCWLVLIGVFGSFGQIALTYAYRMAPASEVSIYNYVGILFSMLLGYFVLGEPITANAVSGGALVVLAALLVYFYTHWEDRRAAEK